jgi:hypothetical protein
MKPLAERRGYKNVFDALWRVATEEGPAKLYSGLLPNILRGMSMNVGMLACFDQAKEVGFLHFLLFHLCLYAFMPLFRRRRGGVTDRCHHRLHSPNFHTIPLIPPFNPTLLTYIWVLLYTYMHIYTHTHIHTYTYTYTYI